MLLVGCVLIILVLYLSYLYFLVKKNPKVNKRVSNLLQNEKTSSHINNSGDSGMSGMSSYFVDLNDRDLDYIDDNNQFDLNLKSKQLLFNIPNCFL